MDLLGGYGSEDDSSSSEDEAMAVPVTAGLASLPDSTLPSAPQSVVPTKVLDVKRQRRGKKLVSLHAVLPSHIWEQLTKSSTLGAAGDYDSDDDDDNIDAKRAVRVPQRQVHHPTVGGGDEGISSLLSDLHAAPTTKFLGGTTMMEPKTISNDPVGFAFTKSVITTRAKDDSVVDVHAKQPKSASSKTEIRANEETSNAIDIASRPPASRAPNASSVPRPGSSTRPVVPAPLFVPKSTESDSPQEPPALQPAYHLDDDDDDTKIHSAEAATTDARFAKKRSRKEMEKALRSGNFSALHDEDLTAYHTEADTYVPQEETYRVPTSGITRVAAVRMYDPKAGTDVVQGEVSSKHRSKHQINQLLASAAALELQRARAIGGTGAKSTRADAKRKYGW